VSYVVPGKPCGQNRNGWNGGAWAKKPEARAFAATLAAHGLRARRLAHWETTTDPVEVSIRVYFADERSDTDAPVKAIIDSLEVSRPKLRRPGAGFLANDRQVRRYLVEREIDRKHPRVEVTIWPASTGAMRLPAPAPCREGCHCGERGGGVDAAMEASLGPPPRRAGKDEEVPA
jgi:hypothetical protein